MDNRKSTFEYLRILKEFSQILKNQSYDGNTTRIPTYWMVQKKERVWHIDPYEANGVLMGFCDEPKVSVEEFKEIVESKIKESFEDPDKVADYCDELKGLKEFDDIKEFCDDIKDYYAFGSEWEVEVLGYNIEWRDIKNEMFLTKRDAKEYIRKFHYKYSEDEKPLRTYAYVAENSPDLSSLIDALKNINWDNIQTSDSDDFTKPNEKRDLIRVTDQYGDEFGIRIPVNIDISKVKIWLKDVVTDNIPWEFKPVDRITSSEYSYHLMMYPETNDEFEILMPQAFSERTDDAIYEWVEERFKDTNYIVIHDDK